MEIEKNANEDVIELLLFVTEDPRGTNPDENWNNPFVVISQYKDGFGLQVYCQGDPVNMKDPYGLTTIIGPPTLRDCPLSVHHGGVELWLSGVQTIYSLMSFCHNSKTLWVESETKECYYGKDGGTVGAIPVIKFWVGDSCCCKSGTTGIVVVGGKPEKVCNGKTWAEWTVCTGVGPACSGG